MFLIISLKSKNLKSLIFFFDVLKKFNISENIKELYANKKIKRFTILKSPHVNKTAQQHFEYRLHSKKIYIKNIQIFKLLVILKKIKINLCCDVLINVKFDINNKNNNFYKKNLNSFYKKKTKLNLLNYNFYGKNKLLKNINKLCLNSSVGRAKD